MQNTIDQRYGKYAISEKPQASVLKQGQVQNLTYENDFHKKGFALGLVLRLRVFGTRKWPIAEFLKEKERNILRQINVT